MITYVDIAFIQEKLETHEYFPVLLTSKKACVNSALFCQKTALYLEEEYGHRFTLYEHSPVAEIRLAPDRENEVWVGDFRIKTNDVVLCTNGFDKFHIVDLH